MRPDGIGFTFPDGIGNQEFHRLSLAAIAANAVQARAISEALAGCDCLFGVIVEGRDYRAFENQTYANDRVRVVTGIRSRRIRDKEKTHLPAGHPLDGRRLQQFACDFRAHGCHCPTLMPIVHGRLQKVREAVSCDVACSARYTVYYIAALEGRYLHLLFSDKEDQNLGAHRCGRVWR
jgi:hypothetical protein